MPTRRGGAGRRGLLQRQRGFVEVLLRERQRALVVYAALHDPQELVPRGFGVALLQVADAQVVVALGVQDRLGGPPFAGKGFVEGVDGVVGFALLEVYLPARKYV